MHSYNLYPESSVNSWGYGVPGASILSNMGGGGGSSPWTHAVNSAIDSGLINNSGAGGIAGSRFQSNSPQLQAQRIAAQWGIPVDQVASSLYRNEVSTPHRTSGTIGNFDPGALNNFFGRPYTPPQANTNISQNMGGSRVMQPAMGGGGGGAANPYASYNPTTGTVPNPWDGQQNLDPWGNPASLDPWGRPKTPSGEIFGTLSANRGTGHQSGAAYY